jgi:hypothetical protein
MLLLNEPPNGSRYPLVGGTRQRYFSGTYFKPRKVPENAQTPTSRVHAVLGAFCCAEQLYWTSSTASGAIILPVQVCEGASCQVIELLWNLFACDLFVKARTGRHGIRHAQLAIAHAVKHHFM